MPAQPVSLKRRLLMFLLLGSLVVFACDVSTPPDTSGSGGGTGSGGNTVTAAPPSDGQPGALPDMATKPKPKLTTFNGCPPEGDGGDPAMNRLKNRIDAGQYVPVKFSAIFDLTWPKTVERRDRSKWSDSDAAAIYQYEGIPVVVEGFLFGGKDSGPESANCHATDAENTDWHVWMTGNAGEDRTHAIVVEPTPRSRHAHPNWTLAQIKHIADGQVPIRVSGWLFFDPEHPDQVGQTRGTIWEIHPVMNFEVQQNGTWIPMDDYSTK